MGADKKIILPDSLLLKVLHAHTRAEVITDFCVPRQFDSFAKLEGYMEKYWHLMDTGDFNMVGHESGHLWKITYPRGSHYGAATRKQGYKLKYIWDDYSDDYGVFGVEPDNTNPTSMFYPQFPPLNNAPSNWSTVDLDQPYSRDFPISGKVRGYGGLSVTASINFIKNIIVHPHLMKNLIWIKLYFALSTFMQDIMVESKRQ